MGKWNGQENHLSIRNRCDSGGEVGWSLSVDRVKISKFRFAHSKFLTSLKRDPHFLVLIKNDFIIPLIETAQEFLCDVLTRT